MSGGELYWKAQGFYRAPRILAAHEEQDECVTDELDESEGKPPHVLLWTSPSDYRAQMVLSVFTRHDKSVRILRMESLGNRVLGRWDVKILPPGIAKHAIGAIGANEEIALRIEPWMRSKDFAWVLCAR